MKVSFFLGKTGTVFAVQCEELSRESITRLNWLLDAEECHESIVKGEFTGPRVGLVTPWSTSAVEIAGKSGIPLFRIETFFPLQEKSPIPFANTQKKLFDPMLQASYHDLTQDIFKINKQPASIKNIEDIAAYNAEEGLALSQDEVEYLQGLAKKLERPLTDCEIFGFSQANSDHCRHKVFNGKFVLDGGEKKFTLFQMIKQTTERNPNGVVSAYKDNCALMRGSTMIQFAPERGDKPSNFQMQDFAGLFSLKAETHNFPTTVEPFNGAATGTGGEIRDRMGAGQGSIPLVGSAVYMTAYPRTTAHTSHCEWEGKVPVRNWLYQSPADILIKASDGTSDFGNKFGQPLIVGGLLTFEHEENGRIQAYDKVIMQAGGVGIAKERDMEKQLPPIGSVIVLLGGDNYLIGMGGGAVSSVSTGEYANAIELNAVQRANPQMQKRVFNVVRAFVESNKNPIFTIHDHGAGGHFNCLSELVDGRGGVIYLDRLPIGDPTLSAKEIIGNESQERMGLVISEEDFGLLKTIADRENAPCYAIGEITGDMKFVFINKDTGETPIDMDLGDIFGNPPKMILQDISCRKSYGEVYAPTNKKALEGSIRDVLSLEGVACKDWLTNKVDRSVTGKIALQQTCGEVQFPLNNLGIVAYDYVGKKGIATSLGFAPVAGLINPRAGSRLAIAKALTNIVFAQLTDGLRGVSLSANWMWPTKTPGELSRAYSAVQAASEFAIALGINIPTGKDSMSMTQKYKDMSVDSPGTVIISAAAETFDVRKAVKPVLQQVEGSKIYYIDFGKSGFPLGGTAFAQTQGRVGRTPADVVDAEYFKLAFEKIQKLICDGDILAGHDISGGGLITSLLEMNFSNVSGGMRIDLSTFPKNLGEVLFSENPAVIIQVTGDFSEEKLQGLEYAYIGTYSEQRTLEIIAKDPSVLPQLEKLFAKDPSLWGSIVEFFKKDPSLVLHIDELRDAWIRPSARLDARQIKSKDAWQAKKRFENYKLQPLSFRFPDNFSGKMEMYGLDPSRRTSSGIQAAIIREQGSNGDREMAWMMHLAGFDVRDVHMTDLIEGRETLEDVNLVVFVGGFSNSDVLGSAKGWAGAFKFNGKAK